VTFQYVESQTTTAKPEDTILPVNNMLLLFPVGGISACELLQTFNCGIGAAIIVGASDVQLVLELITCEMPYVVGTVEALSGEGEEIATKLNHKHVSVSLCTVRMTLH
jgi:phosphoribosylaminoimidazole (AIR) synthetase